MKEQEFGDYLEKLKYYRVQADYKKFFTKSFVKKSKELSYKIINILNDLNNEK